MIILTSGDLDKRQVIQILKQCGLPVDDITTTLLTGFIGLHTGEDSGNKDLAGVAGLEKYGRKGLLRSLAVAPAYRGQRLGDVLTDRIESDARKLGLHRMYLLTTTAEDFFSKRGYREIERSKVPSDIRGSTQFSDICPASATVMCKTL